ncbi:uncharacterized protein EI90DRAFT_2029652 [Cantharellus anzutake]|uniref:uncharacterized protein n=1 Tax=Cantharellus anzutake TaxID=1750568 RepID=UPI001906047B|nr:uncharacterized protein EI90DRAFT_2029652 [Cantharellus anzutake]KAF8325865.1 hypothetical protein EI90DRAFT_2029652 [Cantharellus anzutake]
MVQLDRRMNIGNASVSYDTWTFEPAEEDVDPTVLQDLPYGGSLKTGTYKIRNVETRALLTQDETFPPSPSKPHCSSPLLNCSKELSGERSKFQQWRVFFIKGAQHTDFIASNQVCPWIVLHGEETGEFILYASGSDQVVSTSDEPQAGSLCVTTRLYSGPGRQRWIFEPVDPKGSDLQDPNTPNYPSLFSLLNLR